jgi:hypothetical protein
MANTKKIERQLQGEMIGIFKSLFEKEEKYQSFAIIQEEALADLTIRYNSKNLFFIELKDPKAHDGKSVENSEIFQRETFRAVKNKFFHFGITNFTEAVIYSLDSEVDFKREKRLNYEFRNFPTLQDIDRIRDNFVVTKTLKNKLSNLAKWYLSKAEVILNSGKINLQPPDEIFILKLQKIISNYAIFLSESIFEKYYSDTNFKQEINNYFFLQQWAIPTQDVDFDNFSHIVILTFISKLIFYKAIRDFGTLDKIID